MEISKIINSKDMLAERFYLNKWVIFKCFNRIYSNSVGYLTWPSVLLDNSDTYQNFVPCLINFAQKLC